MLHVLSADTGGLLRSKDDILQQVKLRGIPSPSNAVLLAFNLGTEWDKSDHRCVFTSLMEYIFDIPHQNCEVIGGNNAPISKRDHNSIIVISGGDPEVGWTYLQQEGWRSIVEECPIVLCISAGAMQWGVGYFGFIPKHIAVHGEPPQRVDTTLSPPLPVVHIPAGTA
eukprot:PhF_6_TR34640/c0_g1_i2/m.50412